MEGSNAGGGFLGFSGLFSPHCAFPMVFVVVVVVLVVLVVVLVVLDLVVVEVAVANLAVQCPNPVVAVVPNLVLHKSLSHALGWA